MKIVRLASLLPDMPCLSSPRLWHSRQLALLNLTLNPNSLFCFVTGSSSSFLNFPDSSSSRKSASAFANYLRSHFSVSHPKALHSRARGYLSELHQATCPKESHSSFCSPFWQLPQTSPYPLSLAQSKLPILR